METPTVPINYVPAEEGEILMLGTIKIRIMEDGSRTNKRIGTAEFTLPPHTKGPPSHWHEFHDEIFVVTKGRMQFHGLHGETIYAKLGDHITVSTRSPHTFSNPYDEEAKFFNTYTPSNYIDYFRMLSKMGEAGKPMNADANRKAMAYFGTIGVSDEEMQPVHSMEEPEKGEQVEHGMR